MKTIQFLGNTCYTIRSIDEKTYYLKVDTPNLDIDNKKISYILDDFINRNNLNSIEDYTKKIVGYYIYGYSPFFRTEDDLLKFVKACNDTDEESNTYIQKAIGTAI